MMRPYCIEYKPRLRVVNNGLTWHGFAYRDAENRDAHERLFQTGAKVKITFETGRWLRKRYHLIVGMP